jgi:hypothetical protein
MACPLTLHYTVITFVTQGISFPRRTNALNNSRGISSLIGWLKPNDPETYLIPFIKTKVLLLLLLVKQINRICGLANVLFCALNYIRSVLHIVQTTDLESYFMSLISTGSIKDV